MINQIILFLTPSDYIQIGILIATLIGATLVFMTFRSQNVIFAKQLQLMELEQKRMRHFVFPEFEIINDQRRDYTFEGTITKIIGRELKLKNRSEIGKAYNIEFINIEQLEIISYEIDCAPSSEYIIKYNIGVDFYKSNKSNFTIQFSDIDKNTYTQKIYIAEDNVIIDPAILKS